MPQKLTDDASRHHLRLCDKQERQKMTEKSEGLKIRIRLKAYDHRLIDGKEAVSFLVTIKDLVEDPALLLLDL